MREIDESKVGAKIRWNWSRGSLSCEGSDPLECECVAAFMSLRQPRRFSWGCGRKRKPTSRWVKRNATQLNLKFAHTLIMSWIWRLSNNDRSTTIVIYINRCRCIAASGRLQNANKYCTKVCKTDVGGKESNNSANYLELPNFAQTSRLAESSATPDITSPSIGWAFIEVRKNGRKCRLQRQYVEF